MVLDSKEEVQKMSQPVHPEPKGYFVNFFLFCF